MEVLGFIQNNFIEIGPDIRNTKLGEQEKK
jgi:hypothetical protein